eukprot:CAMPEP_0116822600 /NCGR_PEP_ID=MMETSP0418-20121206/357_1 /TAXON_ID=1158023 /ORGANISM="Astrosyne radiata, Strain 13vi08-1A" /LENGTH=220 /DNA_ID=CAMNT_0004450729 /DNA_START=20 /DNA_END=682 /DNA_ORIENTATION=+
MKIAVVLMLGTATAFSPAPFGMRSTLRLCATEGSALVEAALAAAKEFGTASPEAQLAWEAVEDLDVKEEQSEAMQGSINPEECETDEEASKACIEYNEKIEMLSKMIEEQGPQINKMKQVAEEIQAIKMKVPEAPPSPDSPALRAALANAKKISEESGVTSDEAKVAWAEVEEIASASNDAALGGMLDDECLVETIEACQAIEELQRALNLSNTDSRYSG